jgi:hypothetical protein
VKIAAAADAKASEVLALLDSQSGHGPATMLGVAAPSAGKLMSGAKVAVNASDEAEQGAADKHGSDVKGAAGASGSHKAAVDKAASDQEFATVSLADHASGDVQAGVNDSIDQAASALAEIDAGADATATAVGSAGAASTSHLGLASIASDVVPTTAIGAPSASTSTSTASPASSSSPTSGLTVEQLQKVVNWFVATTPDYKIVSGEHEIVIYDPAISVLSSPSVHVWDFADGSSVAIVGTVPDSILA